MRPVIAQLIWRAVRRVLGLLFLIALVLTGTGGAIVVQGSRDEADRADTAVLMSDGDALSRAARVERATSLYLNSHISRIIVVGQAPAQAQAILLNRGVQADKLQMIRAPSQQAQLDQLHSAFATGRPIDALLIAEPVEILRLLKMAHDRGLPLRGAPTSRTSAIDLGAVVDEVGRYFTYVLASASAQR
ncbi:MAG: hypothetical protein H0X37_04015 [Herpetosiphonaceae bacterium]|nr:hypothetical protein [Herpetosiphonaceae bacterium]